MNMENYIKYVSQTAKNAYPKYVHNYLLKELTSVKLINDNAGLAKMSNNFDVSPYPFEEKLIKSIENVFEVIKFIEKWEFIKPYKHAAIFECENFSQRKVEELVSNLQIKAYTNSINEFDQLTTLNPKSYSLQKFFPTKYENDDCVYLKFSLQYEHFPPASTEKSRLKYPIVAVFYKNLDVLEIRFDRISTVYKENEYFYKNLLDYILDWLKARLGICVKSINLQPVIEKLVKEKQDEVKVHAQSMSMKMGGKATLEVGNNEKFVLPLLGELKGLMEEHKDEFNEAPVIKQILENFISDIELTSDLPWISLCWLNAKKVNQIVVKFIHWYLKEDYSLLQYYGITTSGERMNYVTRYLIENSPLDKKVTADK